MTTNLIHFTYHNEDEFIQRLKRQRIDTVFRSSHNKRIRFRGITEDCQRMFTFEEEMPGISGGYSGYGNAHWTVNDSGEAVYRTTDRKCLHDELTRQKVNGDQLSAFRRKAKNSLAKSVTVSASDESTEEEEITEKSVKQSSQRKSFAFDRENDRPITLTMSLSKRSYGTPELEFELKVPPIDNSHIDNIVKCLTDADIKIVSGHVSIERLM